MASNKPTLTALRARIIADIELATGRAASTRGDMYYPIAMAHAGACYGMHGYLDYNRDQLFDDSADEDYLLLRAAEYGIYRLPAYRAQGTASITGNDGAVIPADSVFKAGDISYRSTDDAVIADGTAVLTLRALLGGESGNQPPATTLALISTLAGVDSTATVIEITGGADTESIARVRERLAERKQKPPMGGNPDDYVRWAKEAHPDVTRAWTYSNENGPGTVVVRFVTDNLASPIPTQTHIDAVTEYIDSVRPAGMAGFEVGMLDAKPLDITFTLLSPNTAAVQQAINAELADMIKREASPGSTIRLSWLNEAISIAQGENDHAIDIASDVTSHPNQLIVLGTLTFPA